ncbi:hypothetical protein B7Y94_00880 [Candidatus Saccharibacteria bacterium 32-49-12]|nr:MAG: hypothetical protein B7Y94_00880 [Candidatus Saccharibacteria bacterium 32-49-12]
MKTVKLGDVLEKTSTIKWRERPQDHIYSYVDLTSVDRSRHEIIQTSKINAKNAPSRAQKIIKTDDVLFGTTRPTLNRLCIVPGEYDEQICSTGFCVLRANTDLVTPSFVYYLLTTKAFVEYVEATQRGTSYPAVTDKDVKQFEFVLPSLEEQKKIVERLDAAFKKISAAEVLMRRNLDNVAMLQKSILHKYLSVSDSARTHRFEDIISLVRPKEKLQQKQFLSEGSYPIISQEASFINGYWNDQTILIEDNGPLVVWGDHTTVVKYVDFPFVAGADGTKIFKPIHGIDTKWLYYWLLANPIDKLGYARHYRILKASIVSVPSIETQLKAVKAVDSVFARTDKLIKKFEYKLDKISDLRQSLLQQAFSTTK